MTNNYGSYASPPLRRHDPSSSNFEVFSAESLLASLIKKIVQKVDSIILWIQMNFYPNPSGMALQEAF
jgi:hypothetical protein